MQETTTAAAVGAVTGPVTAERVADVIAALAREDGDLVALTRDLNAPDVADLLALLEPDQRVQLIQRLGPAFDVEVFSELDETVRDQLSEAIPNETLAKVVGELETDDAAYLIEGLASEDRKEILDALETSDRVALERNLEYPEETAGRIMQSDFVAVPPFWTVGQVIDHMRESEELPDTFSDIFVVDPTHRVLGTIDLSRLLRTKRQVGIDQIMSTERHLVLATSDQEEVARQFERHDLKSAPVVDANRRLVGVVTVDDMVDVMRDEADEDIKALAGVGDEDVTDNVVDTARSRITWLVVNLFTAMLASTVIRMFDATISQMIALAALMPIVASMGGNAGTQTMTVTVRALATNKLGPVNAIRMVTREALVGLLNGLVLALIVSVVVFFWFGSGKLGLVIGAAMIVNLMAAALAGILVPMTLNRYGLDPAPASGVFVTTVTDVVGFFAFLGLAALWMTK
ncbi:MAG TPA: magnesium transporter [Hyphomicrobiaceae bacterium]|nr:magnesium transporter [Hyphomicrobiaceae bacterium]